MGITLIGTSHIAKESVQKIKQFVEENQPDIIAVELDAQRLSALLQKKKRKIGFADIRHIGVKGYLFALIGGYIQEKLGKYVGVKPGSDMLTAVKLAKKHQIKLALIDRPIDQTLRRFSKSITWKEKFRIVGDIFSGFFFRKKRMKELGLENFDLRKVTADKGIRKMMKHMKKRYPSIYRVLVHERNVYMVKKLQHIHEQFPDKNILVVVGAGHESEMQRMIQKFIKNEAKLPVGSGDSA